jgi:Immunity protein Imm1
VGKPAALDLQIDGRYVETDDLGALRAALVSISREEFAEVWLTVEDGPGFALLKSGPRALCLFVRELGDPGFTSRQFPRERRRGLLDFHLASGQVDQYPASWTVPFFVALRAADHFLRSGERPPFLRWHSDV